MQVTKRQLQLLIKEATAPGNQTVLTEQELREVEAVLFMITENPLAVIARGAQAATRVAAKAAKEVTKAATRAAKAAKKKMVQKAKDTAKDAAIDAAKTSQSAEEDTGSEASVGSTIDKAVSDMANAMGSFKDRLSS